MLRSMVFGFVTLVALGLAASNAHAKYARPDLENTPVARLIENLTKQVEADPKNVAARYNLARVHAMAYALKTDTAQVNRGDPGKGAWFGYAPKHVPFAVQQTDDAEKLKAAKEHLSQAIGRYKEIIDRARTNLPAQLGYAWCLEQSSDKAGAIAEYRKAIELGWKAEKDLTRAGLGFHSITAEAAGYLVPLLDAEKDRAELVTLAERIAFVAKIPRPITPLAIPLRSGVSLAEMENRDARVTFDADGSGHAKKWSWITPNAGWLVYDQRGTGRIDSALQMFGNVTFWCFWENGYDALASLDNNRDGRISGTELVGLAIWQDANGNGISEPGEVKPLSAWGIVSLSCAHQVDATHRDRIPFSPGGAIFANGEKQDTYDVILHSRP